MDDELSKQLSGDQGRSTEMFSEDSNTLNRILDRVDLIRILQLEHITIKFKLIDEWLDSGKKLEREFRGKIERLTQVIVLGKELSNGKLKLQTLGKVLEKKYLELDLGKELEKEFCEEIEQLTTLTNSIGLVKELEKKKLELHTLLTDLVKELEEKELELQTLLTDLGKTMERISRQKIEIQTPLTNSLEDKYSLLAEKIRSRLDRIESPKIPTRNTPQMTEVTDKNPEFARNDNASKQMSSQSNVIVSNRSNCSDYNATPNVEDTSPKDANVDSLKNSNNIDSSLTCDWDTDLSNYSFLNVSRIVRLIKSN